MTAATSVDRRGTWRYLAASQAFFQGTGRWRMAQLIFVVAFPTCVAIYGSTQTRQPFWIPLTGFLAAILDATLFNWAISSGRYRAAQLASLYDASLVSKSPLSPRTVGIPAPERVRGVAEDYVRRPKDGARITDWHYGRIQEVAPPIAELLYVRSDVVHDEQLREFYAPFLLTVGLVVSIVIVVLAGSQGWDIPRLFSNVLFPIVPAATWLCREIVDQFNALARKRGVRALLDETLINAQMKEPNEDVLVREREALHGMQFLFRCTQPSIAGWLESQRRRRIRLMMERTLDDFINDAIASGHAASGSMPSPGDYTQQ